MRSSTVFVHSKAEESISDKPGSKSTYEEEFDTFEKEKSNSNNFPHILFVIVNLIFITKTICLYKYRRAI